MLTVEQRFWSKVDKNGPKRKSMPTRCWVWLGALQKPNHKTGGRGGYGFFWFEVTNVYAHRMAWFLTHGEWPSATIDHLCRRRSCVRPSHLEDVSLAVNLRRGKSPTGLNARKLECKRGHPLSGSNLRIDIKGGRVCRVCARMHGAVMTQKRPSGWERQRLAASGPKGKGKGK